MVIESPGAYSFNLAFGLALAPLLAPADCQLCAIGACAATTAAALPNGITVRIHDLPATGEGLSNGP